MANERLINSISVGIVYVAGPDEHAITNAEKDHILAEVQEGLEDLANNEPDANISWTYNTLSVDVNVTPWQGARWPGLPEDFYKGFDAAVWHGVREKIYFFKGDEYTRYTR